MKHRINKTADASEIERLRVDKGLCMTEQRRIVARFFPRLTITLISKSCINVYGQLIHELRCLQSTAPFACSVETGLSRSTILVSGERAWNRLPKHHGHLIDIPSGKVIEFRSDKIERLLAKTASQLGYRIVQHRLELYAVPIDDD